MAKKTRSYRAVIGRPGKPTERRPLVHDTVAVDIWLGPHRGYATVGTNGPVLQCVPADGYHFEVRSVEGGKQVILVPRKD